MTLFAAFQSAVIKGVTKFCLIERLKTEMTNRQVTHGHGAARRSAGRRAHPYFWMAALLVHPKDCHPLRASSSVAHNHPFSWLSSRVRRVPSGPSCTGCGAWTGRECSPHHRRARSGTPQPQGEAYPSPKRMNRRESSWSMRDSMAARVKRGQNAGKARASHGSA